MKDRYTNPSEVIALIDKYKKDIVAMNALAYKLESASKSLLEQHTGKVEVIMMATDYEVHARKIRTRVAWREQRLKILGGKLSELQTPVLSPECGDGSVEAL